MVLENWMVVLGCVSIQRNRRENNGVSCSIVHVAEAFSYEVVGNTYKKCEPTVRRILSDKTELLSVVEPERRLQVPNAARPSRQNLPNARRAAAQRKESMLHISRSQFNAPAD